MLKKLFIKINKIRNEVENKIADILNLLQSEKVDNVEEKIITVGIKQGISTASSGSVTFTDEQVETIAKAIIKGLNKANDITQKQLRK